MRRALEHLPAAVRAHGHVGVQDPCSWSLGGRGDRLGGRCHDRRSGCCGPRLQQGRLSAARGRIPVHTEVYFPFLDEVANMVWAIEKTVRGRSGDPRPRAAERRPRQAARPEGMGPEERLYRLQSLVPPEWIPLVPFAPRVGQVALRKGALLRDGDPVLAAGATLAPTPLTFADEEIPREGVDLRAVPSLARRADGSYAKWVAYHVRVGTGSAASNLAWDSAISVTDT